MKALLDELGNLAATYGLSNLARAYKTFCKREGGASPERKRMNPIGKVGRRRLALVAELKVQAKQGGWLNTCEIGPVLRNRGITFIRCGGDLQFCHSTKCSPRGKDPVLDRETARGCEYHHQLLDQTTHAVQLSVVQEAIRRRQR